MILRVCYLNSNHGFKEPFVQVGSVVNPNDTLCVLEAMKTFNQVKSEISGTVTAVLKSSGDPVEYGETLFIIDPT